MATKQAIHGALVQEFVGNAHGDLTRVRELLDREPGLLNAAHDWGNGDWETALGAASHMGRRDIAEYLLAQGARLDLFAAAMLGQLAIVRAAIEAFPAMRAALGPHGIPLIEHARSGGDAAADVLRFIEEGSA
ncbi:MAG TPA: ankyrin repeat domain-containing protein [Chloroflexota bacterium]|nr:ankyrin repeat domain-containing protein [Chloroflexota bacterium]